MYRRPTKDYALSNSSKHKENMASDAMFSFDDFNFVASQDELSCTPVDGANIGYGFYQAVTFQEGLLFSKYQQQEHKSEQYLNYEVFDDQRFDIFSPPFQTCLQEIEKLDDEIPSGIQHISESKTEIQNQNQNQTCFSFASLELLKKYDNGRINGGRIVKPGSDAPCTKGLSTEEVIRIAGARFIQSCWQAVDITSMLHNPFGLFFSDLSDDESRNVELVELLLASAEKVGYQQFERASRLLNHCELLSSNIGNPVQRVVYHFSEALKERIDRETGRFPSIEYLRKKQPVDPNHNAASLACHQKIPFIQVARFTAIQEIVENVARAKRIHIIDLEIRSGAQWPVLMQALMSRHHCPLELLKISAIGTTSKHLIEDTGKRLASFAESMNVPFSFRAVMVSDMLDLKKELFELDSEEAVAVYSEYFLMNLLVAPNRLESIMGMLRNINPNVMVVMEVEANNNSPSFVHRFIEALFFYSAYFDCFDACMERDDPNRMAAESVFFHHGIRNIVASEGEERRIRHVKIDVWRSFFARFGMIQTELSTSSLYQASLVLKKFPCGSSCTLDVNEKSLNISWKATPISSLSVWKFI
eukprot:XP_025013131.1 DELLA protein RGL1 [Ricinus communis]